MAAKELILSLLKEGAELVIDAFRNKKSQASKEQPTNIREYKGSLISDTPNEEDRRFCNEDGTELEEAFLVLAAIKKIPENIDAQWLIFSYPVAINDYDGYFSGCGMQLPVASEMKGFVNTIAGGAFVPDAKWIVSKDGHTSLEEERVNYAMVIETHGLTWDQKSHNFQQGAYPMDATANNIKLLTGLHINPRDIDEKDECGLGIFLIDR